jgi:stringent starvation protein B
MAADGISIPSTKPYLIRALHGWCSDNGFTPFIAVFVDGRVEVPMEFVKNDEIVLNLSSEACHQLDLGNEWVSFQARFGGVPKRVMVPVTHVLAIYARENGQGMSFPFDGAKTPDSSNASEDSGDAPKKAPRPTLTIVK